MTGQAHWLPFLIVLVAIAALGLALVRDRIAWKRIPGVKRRVTCPTTGQRTNLILAQDTASGGFFGVRSCSRFSPEDAVHCAQECKDALQPPARPLIGSAPAE